MEKKSVNLTARYAPEYLKDVVGQEHVTSYFRSVIQRPAEAHKNHVLLGSYGNGKTSIARAFSRGLLGTNDLRNTPNYVEIDSSDHSIVEDFNKFRDYVFQTVPGYKVVVLDEVHLMDKEHQQKFLKPIEDFVGDIFFFFVSTEEGGIIPTILSRSITFNIYSFTDVQLESYLKGVLEKEGITLRQETINHIVFSSYGHIRNLLNQAQICLFQGEDYYLEQYSKLDKSIDAYFRSKDFSSIESLVKTPFEILRRALEYYVMNVIIKKKEVFKASDVPKVFTFYLKMKKYVSTENDFYSFMYTFKEYFNQFVVEVRQ